MNALVLGIGLCIWTLFSAITVKKLTASVSTESRPLPIYSVETEKKQIAVTFDAAWGAEDTDEIISILKKHNAKITIYAVGEWVERNPDAVKKFFENGNEIGNHSATHPHFSKISREEIKEEIIQCNEAIKKIIGEAPKTLRAPSGDYDYKSIEVTKTLGMEMIQWDCDSLDWKNLSVDEIYERIIKKAGNGSILLFHNGVENTPKALDKILGELSKQGYEFVTVSHLIYKDNYIIDHTGRQISVNDEK